MSYYLADVDKAERVIRAAVPGVRLERFDYNFGLMARLGNKSVIVCQPPRRLDCADQIDPDPDAVIMMLSCP